MNYISKDEIVENLSRFYKENGYFPTKLEIEECEYLPSPMSIYRKLGSLSEVREKLKMKAKPVKRDKHLTSMQKEIDGVSKYLAQTLPQADVATKVATEGVGVVHVVLKLPNAKNEVYIHFFSAKTSNSLGYTVRTLQKRYADTDNKVLLVCMRSLTQAEIQKYLENRIQWLPDHINVLSSRYFRKYIDDTLKVVYNKNVAV